MNLSQPSESTPRTGWHRIAITAGLLLASILTIVNSVQLARWSKQDQASAQNVNIQALTARIDTLETQVDAFKHLPKTITQGDFDAVRQALEERLSRLEQLQGTDARSDDVQTLQLRVNDIEAHLKKSAAQRATARPHTASTIKPQVPEPPFTVVGVELRGGERFLTIAAPGATSLSQVRLLREGEADSGWQLQSIDTHVAVFRVYDQTLRIALP